MNKVTLVAQLSCLKIEMSNQDLLSSTRAFAFNEGLETAIKFIEDYVE